MTDENSNREEETNLHRDLLKTALTAMQGSGDDSGHVDSAWSRHLRLYRRRVKTVVLPLDASAPTRPRRFPPIPVLSWAAVLVVIVVVSVGFTAGKWDQHSLSPSHRKSNSTPVCVLQAPSSVMAVSFYSPNDGIGLRHQSGTCGATSEKGSPAYRSRVQLNFEQLSVTSDGGESWSQVGSNLPGWLFGGDSNWEFEALTWQLVAISDRQIWIWGGGSLGFSDNGGETWKTVRTPAPVESIHLSGNSLWAVLCVSFQHDESSVCRSELERWPAHGGVGVKVSLPNITSWAPPTLTFDSPSVAVLLTDPLVSGSGLFVTRDAGTSWNTISNVPYSATCGQMYSDIAFSGENWWLLCAGSGAGVQNTQVLYRSTDSGTIWTIAAEVTNLAAPTVAGELTSSPSMALAAGSPNLVWFATTFGLAESTDGGVMWENVPGTFLQGALNGSFDVISPSRAWFIAPGMGLFRTTNGTTWQKLSG
jgi:hypothetical protein